MLRSLTDFSRQDEASQNKSFKIKSKHLKNSIENFLTNFHEFFR